MNKNFELNYKIRTHYFLFQLPTKDALPYLILNFYGIITMTINFRRYLSSNLKYMFLNKNVVYCCYKIVIKIDNSHDINVYCSFINIAINCVKQNIVNIRYSCYKI